MELKGSNNCQAFRGDFSKLGSPSPAQQLISDLRVRNQNTSNLSRGTGQFYTLTTFFFFPFFPRDIQQRRNVYSKKQLIALSPT